MEPTITRLGWTHDALGEGPWWDHSSQRLYWVDSVRGRLYRRRLDDVPAQHPTGSAPELVDCVVDCWTLPQRVGSVAIADDTLTGDSITGDGTAIVALENGVYRLDLAQTDARCFTEGRRDAQSDPSVKHRPSAQQRGPSAKERLRLIAGIAPDARLRFNDGKTDRQGRFLTGTMGIKDRSSGIAALYRLERARLVRVVDDVIVTNGPCFSPDGKLFYFTDGRRRVLRYTYDPATGALGERHVHIDMNVHATGSDGATVDAEGCLWTALIGSGEVACFAPDGALIRRIRMPCRLPSSVMFAGERLDRLIVTSISDSGNRTAQGEHDGGLFVVDGIGTKGVPEVRAALENLEVLR